jgi:hypothetical protein
VQVAHVAGYVQCRDLPFSVTRLIKPADDARDDQRGVIDTFSKRDKIPVPLNLLGVTGEVENCLPFFITKDRAAGQSVEKRLKIGSTGVSHTVLPVRKREQNVSQAPTPAGD